MELTEHQLNNEGIETLKNKGYTEITLDHFLLSRRMLEEADIVLFTYENKTRILKEKSEKSIKKYAKNILMMEEKNHDVKPCKGIVVKAETNHYVSGKKRIGFCLHIRLRILKKKSCSGCEVCGGIWDAINEVCNDWPIDGIEDAQHGRLYQIVCVGDEDDWNLELKEINYNG